MSDVPGEISEKRLDFLESQIPALSASAIRLACFSTLDSGHSVLEAMADGSIYEVFPDGTRQFFKKASPYIQCEVGTKFFLK